MAAAQTTSYRSLQEINARYSSASARDLIVVNAFSRTGYETISPRTRSKQQLS